MAFAQHRARSSQQQQQTLPPDQQQLQDDTRRRAVRASLDPFAIQPHAEDEDEVPLSALATINLPSNPSRPLNRRNKVGNNDRHRTHGGSSSQGSSITNAASGSDWTLVFPGRPQNSQHSNARTGHGQASLQRATDPISPDDPFVQPVITERAPRQPPTSPSGILTFPHAPLGNALAGASTVDSLGGASYFGENSTFSARPQHSIATSALSWLLPSAPTDSVASHQQRAPTSEEQPATRRSLARKHSDTSSSVLSLSTSYSSGVHSHATEATGNAVLVAPPSPSAISGGTGSMILAPDSISPSAGASVGPFGFHLPAAPSTAGDGTSPDLLTTKRRRRKARSGQKSARHGDASTGLGLEVESSRVTSSEDSDNQDERSSKRSNNSGSAAARRLARRASDRPAGRWSANASANTSPRLGSGARLQLRGDGITVLRPSSQAQDASEEESTEEGKIPRRTPSASTRLISAILRKLFTLEPDVLDAFLLGSENHVLGPASSNAAPKSTGGARSTSSTDSSRPRRTVRFADFTESNGSRAEAQMARAYEYQYRTFGAAYKQSQARSGTHASSAEPSVDDPYNQHPILALAQISEREGDAENDDAQDDLDGDLQLIKVHAERSGEDTATSTRRRASGAFEHPLTQARMSEHDNSTSTIQGSQRGFASDEAGGQSDLSADLSATDAPATMMEPTAWEAVRALFDERLAQQAYSFHEGIGLPLSLRLLRWVLKSSGMWSNGKDQDSNAGVALGIGWDGTSPVAADEDADNLAGEDMLSEVDAQSISPAAMGGANGDGEKSVFRARREWERAWARGVAMAGAEAESVGEDTRRGDDFGYGGSPLLRSYSAFDLASPQLYMSAASTYQHVGSSLLSSQQHHHHHHHASHGDLRAFAAAIQEFGGGLHASGTTGNRRSSQLVPDSSTAALGLGFGTAGVGGAVEFTPTMQGALHAHAHRGDPAVNTETVVRRSRLASDSESEGDADEE
ncbi:hypothetical protein OC846_004968 [Tilletia horrida]|uniref:Uncharacterized protein n=1 Tax=Tilletia horrida TaxID=155126 RepID=A0AAN6GP85_9BASI|nr:hypothetical protein OC846_004968 [Tilletia horrida]KAK0548674.1 hypothetical protein OC845_003463 [Tilletia horrida]KAK0565592.1 hypothetical protein OC861_003686 [Tilletia horrida]